MVKMFGRCGCGSGIFMILLICFGWFCMIIILFVRKMVLLILWVMSSVVVWFFI